VFQPTTFGKYFLTRRIAVGGMAEVYAAKLYGADGFEKDLVIKQILPQHARDPEFVQSFVAEAKIAVGLSHANIVAIYELGRVDGTYFIAMELVDGLDTFALLEAARRHQVPVPVGSAVRIVEEVAHGLDYAHRRRGPDGAPLGLVHRDLNPRNVLVSRDGDVKILDFGIAKTAPGVADMPKTRAGVVKGTTGYMSPEQAAGREIDARTDIYQAGLLLYELLTGTPVFWTPDEGETRSRMRAHAISAPSAVRREIPPEVDKVVLGALTRDRDRRYRARPPWPMRWRRPDRGCRRATPWPWGTW
jgi:serine/threonine protein kinase